MELDGNQKAGRVDKGRQSLLDSGGVFGRVVGSSIQAYSAHGGNRNRRPGSAAKHLTGRVL